jgi:hypothetical protein
MIYGRRSSYGRRDLKAVFKTAGLVAMSGKGVMRKYYEQMLEEGKHTKTARNAVCRKIAASVLFVLKSKKPFSEKHFEKKIEGRRKTNKLEMSE